MMGYKGYNILQTCSMKKNTVCVRGRLLRYSADWRSAIKQDDTEVLLQCVRVALDGREMTSFFGLNDSCRDVILTRQGWLIHKIIKITRAVLGRKIYYLESTSVEVQSTRIRGNNQFNSLTICKSLYAYAGCTRIWDGVVLFSLIFDWKGESMRTSEREMVRPVHIVYCDVIEHRYSEELLRSSGTKRTVR